MEKVSVKLTSPAKIDGQRRAAGETVEVDPSHLAGLAADGVIDPHAAGDTVVAFTDANASLAEMSEKLDAVISGELKAREALDLCEADRLKLLKQVAEAEGRATKAEDAAKALETELAELKAATSETAKTTTKKAAAAKG